MVMDKKGFLKILEAIIAIIIVFGFVIAVYPKAPSQSEVPEDLKLTMDAIVKQAQNDPTFRECVLGGRVILDTEEKSGVGCINEFIKKNSPPLFPWGHGIKLCDLEDEGNLNKCEYGKGDSSDSGKCEPNPNVLCSDCNAKTAEDEKRKCFNNEKLPLDRNVFTRTVSLSVQDVAARPIPPVTEDPRLEDRNPSSKSLTLYFWFKG
ncbi:MAG TPA: hypothetical protein VJG30_04525 [Candidatus Nanoarchaeia archaeon]|nr:hypothetical protein [Candidatus Nanoarchaeia archaeon]